jgi:hypothetical protein
MQFFDGVGDLTPLVEPMEAEWPILWGMIERLRELDYTERSASDAMGVGHLGTRDAVKWPFHLRSCHRQAEEHPAAILTAFFLVEDWVDRTVLIELLGEPVVKLMHNLRWTRKRDQQIGFKHFLFPCQGRYLLTDGSVREEVSLSQVYYIGSDSYLLTWLTPRKSVGYTLDHCTGSGIHAMLASYHATRSFGLDINTRALSFSRFNAKMNKAGNVSYLASDCYTNVVPEHLGTDDAPKFDLITANPPFVPTPDSIALCRGGGLSGEDVTEKIIKGLPKHLSPQGLFSMITNIPVLKDSTFFDRCERWLAPHGENYAMISLHCFFWTPVDYAISHLGCGAYDQKTPELRRWLESYDEVGLVGVTYSQVFIFPHQMDKPWRFERGFGMMDQPRGAFVESWIDSLRRFSDRPTQPQTFFRNPELAKIWWVEGRQQAYLEWSQAQSWWHAVPIWLEGQRSAIFDRFEQPASFSWSTPEELEALRWLLQENILQVKE